MITMPKIQQLDGTNFTLITSSRQHIASHITCLELSHNPSKIDLCLGLYSEDYHSKASTSIPNEGTPAVFVNSASVEKSQVLLRTCSTS